MENAKVLIVEDEPNSVKILSAILKKIGCEVLDHASSGKDAIHMLRTHEPDIIMMDISIQGPMDGIETASEIHKRKNIPIIYLTASSSQRTFERAKLTDPFGYIIKPFTEQNVSVALELGLFKANLYKSLQASEQRLSVTLEALHDAIISTDLDGNITYINPAAASLLRKDASDIKGKRVGDVLHLYHRVSQKKIENPLKIAIVDSKLFDTSQPFVLRSANEDERYVYFSKSILYDRDDDVKNGYVLLLKDCTSQYHSEKRIRMMAAALESIDEAVIITNVNFSGDMPTLIYVNECFAQITGYSKDEVIGKSIDILCGEKTNPDLTTKIARNANFEGEYVNYQKNGDEFFALWSSASVYSFDGNLIHNVYTVRDVTQIRKMEESISRSQKVEAIGRLAGGVAHDFNNLLAVISAYAELLNLKLPPEDPLLKYSNNILDAAKKGTQLVAQLMTFSRREPKSLQEIDLAKAVTGTKDMLQRVFPHNVTLETNIEEPIPTIYAEPGHIDQILLNLSVNSRDAMPKGGIITFNIKQIDAHREKLNSRPPSVAKYVLLSVSDNGTGIDEATKKHIFDPFFTTKAIGEGTGLGLSTVYGIVKQCKGYIEVESELGKGTTFNVFFPILSKEVLMASRQEEISSDTQSA
ncbi:MAG: hypothetical protein COX01_00245 [Verrucomicrobia bacterium CG22_combo_CG10-13_8_21_14_all_43_17]|nr:MAG: hypothetical protein AUJ82_05870 [Verrucomicrobia bacterium CG1_02_43_26]PIP60026.1 MAG: hypothetical protein COX01_00245 [Verrucomicrobia bacterium CG22_combo_CG10-13_8_21_14_all_43_17]